MLVSNRYAVTATRTLLRTIIVITQETTLQMILVYRSPSSSATQTIEMLQSKQYEYYCKKCLCNYHYYCSNGRNTTKPINTFMNSLSTQQQPTTVVCWMQCISKVQKPITKLLK